MCDMMGLETKTDNGYNGGYTLHGNRNIRLLRDRITVYIIISITIISLFVYLCAVYYQLRTVPSVSISDCLQLRVQFNDNN